MTRQPRTLGATLRRAVASPVLMLGAGVLGFGAVSTAVAFDLVPETGWAAPGASAPATGGDVSGLLEQHGCWSGPAPADMAGEVPGGVVFTAPGDGPSYSAEPAVVGRALRHVFDRREPGLVVHGFCRGVDHGEGSR